MKPRQLDDEHPTKNLFAIGSGTHCIVCKDEPYT
jgi:hypothetical protein